MGRAILIASGKGGAGRTTFAVNMGATLAQRGKKVCLLDMNIGIRNLDIYMGLEDKVLFDLSDIMSGICKVEKALVRDERFADLCLLESPQGRMEAAPGAMHMHALLRQLKASFDYILIDAPAPFSADTAWIAPSCDSAVLVLHCDYLALRNTDAENARLAQLGIKNRCYVVNMVREELYGQSVVPSLDEIDRCLRIPMAGIIPFDLNIHIGNNAGCPVATAKGSYVADNFETIVTRMLG